MNGLLILSLLLLLIVLILLFFIYEMIIYKNKVEKIISYYIKVYESEKNMKSVICNSNKDCSNEQVCQMDIDKEKRCFSKDNMIKRICTKLIVPWNYYYPI